jgi:hypothetical protein
LSSLTSAHQVFCSFRACASIQFLASITTIIDVAGHYVEPTPFGTQHIALLLAAWGPAIVFGEYLVVVFVPTVLSVERTFADNA